MQIGRVQNGWIDTQTNRETDIHTYRQTDIFIFLVLYLLPLPILPSFNPFPLSYYPFLCLLFSLPLCILLMLSCNKYLNVIKWRQGIQQHDDAYLNNIQQTYNKSWVWQSLFLLQDIYKSYRQVLTSTQSSLLLLKQGHLGKFRTCLQSTKYTHKEIHFNWFVLDRRNSRP